MSAAADHDAPAGAGPTPRDLLADLPEAAWSGLLPFVRTTLDRAVHEPRRLAPFAGWHPEKFDRPEVRRAVADVLAADARFRAELRAVVKDGHPDVAAAAEEGRPGCRHVDAADVGPTAAALVAWGRWDALAVLADRTAEADVRTPLVAADGPPGPHPPDPQPADRDPGDPDADGPGPAGGRTRARGTSPLAQERARARRAERRLADRDRRLESQADEIARLRRDLAAVRDERDAARAELRDEKARQRDRLSRLRRRAHDARERAAAAEQRVDWVTGRLAGLLDGLTGPLPAETDAGPAAEDSTAAPALRPDAAAVPRGARAARPGRPCVLPPGVVGDTPEAAQALLQVERLELFVDGYNVSKDLRGRPAASLADQRLWLVKTLAGALAGLPVRATVVFDAAEGVGGPAPSARGLRVVFTDTDEIADDLIVRFVEGLATDVPVCVVTSDRAVRAAVGERGGDTVSSGVFLQAIGASS